MPLCSVCGKQNREQARFCGYCGRPLQGAPPQPAEETRKAPQTPSSARWLRQVPGFRSGTRWKQIVAAVGYSVIALAIVAGAAADDAALLLLGVDALATVLLATNVWSLRSRVPPFNSPSKLKVASGWGILLLLGFVALSIVVTTLPRRLPLFSPYPASEIVGPAPPAQDMPVASSQEEETLHQIGRLEEQAASYAKEGKYAEAEPFAKRAMEIAEKDLGSEHPLVALELAGLAWLYSRQGKYEEAVPLYRRSLRLKELQQAGGRWRFWWDGHPARRAGILEGLAEVYSKQRRYDEAVPLLERVLDIHEKALGPGMLLAQGVAVLEKLADVYEKTGRGADAGWVRERISGTGPVAGGTRTFQYEGIGRVRFTFPPGLPPTDLRAGFKYYVSVPQTTAGPRIKGEDGHEGKFEIQVYSYRRPQSYAKWKQRITDKLRPELAHAVESDVHIKRFDTSDRLFYATLTDTRPNQDFLLLTSGVYVDRHAVILLHHLSNDRSGQGLDRVLRLIASAEFLDVDKWPNLSGLGPIEKFGLRITPEASGEKLRIEGRGHQIFLPGAEEDWTFESLESVETVLLAARSDSLKMFVTVGVETYEKTAEQYISEYVRLRKRALSELRPPQTITHERFISRSPVTVYAYSVSGRPYFIAIRKTADGRVLELQVSALMFLHPSEADVIAIERHVTETMAPSLAELNMSGVSGLGSVSRR